MNEISAVFSLMAGTGASDVVSHSWGRGIRVPRSQFVWATVLYLGATLYFPFLSLGFRRHGEGDLVIVGFPAWSKNAKFSHTAARFAGVANSNSKDA